MFTPTSSLLSIVAHSKTIPASCALKLPGGSLQLSAALPAARSPLAEFRGAAVRLGGCAAVHAGEVAGLGDFPDGDEWPFIEVGRVDLRVHEPMKRPETGRCSDQSPKLLEFPSDC